jgi:glycerate kinase
MKIVIAPDSFKGSISSIRACKAIEAGVKEVFSDAELILMPIADGGEGTVDSFTAACACEKAPVNVTGPLGQKVEAVFAVLEDGTAVIEMAAASGLTLVKDKNPLKATTFGTGQLIKAALDRGCKKIIIGLGGSATNDGGAGVAQALGFSLKDRDGNEIGFGGGELDKLHTIDCTNADTRLMDCEIIAACDVTNILCGKNGASPVFGPQKGADPQTVELLDANLSHYADVIEKQLGIQLKDIPGTGAAGGLSAGLIAFCNAEIKPGIELILDTIGFDGHLKDADLVITGEGKIDYQSAFGKVPVGVAKRAKQAGVPVIAIAGAIGEGAEAVYNYGINSIVSIINKPATLSFAMDNVEKLLKDAVKRLMLILKIGMNIDNRKKK